MVDTESGLLNLLLSYVQLYTPLDFFLDTQWTVCKEVLVALGKTASSLRSLCLPQHLWGYIWCHIPFRSLNYPLVSKDKLGHEWLSESSCSLFSKLKYEIFFLSNGKSLKHANKIILFRKKIKVSRNEKDEDRGHGISDKSEKLIQENNRLTAIRGDKLFYLQES